MSIEQEDADILEYYKSYGVLRRQIEILKLELKGLTSERERLKNEILSLLDKAEALRREVDELEEKRRVLESEIKRLEAEREKLVQEIQIVKTAGISAIKSYEESMVLTEVLQELLKKRKPSAEEERKVEEAVKKEALRVSEKERAAVKVEVKPREKKVEKPAAKKPVKRSVLATLIDKNMKSVLEVIAASDEIDVSEVALRTGLSLTSVRSIAAILWGYNLVEMRSEKIDDKISVKYRITEKGRKILEELA
ncbi:MAG: hypothetical protein DRJ63_04860 [Thermoprotei archaeon]|nr:MAG: hypothetical protein DRJ63_04860 [Thermoprotei archaeon]